jgi:hypothetical protein
MIIMGINDWRAKRHMKQPERGVLRVSGIHHSFSSSGHVVTGVITAPGIPDTPVEHKVDDHGRWTGIQEVPVLVDRADPSKFVILWDEVQPASWGDQMAAAQGAPGRPGTRHEVIVTATATIVTRGPDGRPVISSEGAAGVEALRAMVGKVGGGQGLGQLISQALEQATGQPSADTFGRPPAETFGRPEVSGYVEGGGQPFGTVDPQAFGTVDPQAFHQPGAQPDEQE